MRKSFFTKAIVAAGVMASAMVLSSMAVFAATANEAASGFETKSGDTTTYDFTKQGTNLDLNTVGDTYGNVYVNKVNGGYPKIASNEIYIKGAEIGFPIKDTTVRVNVTAKSKSGNKTDRYLLVDKNENKKISMSTNGLSTGDINLKNILTVGAQKYVLVSSAQDFKLGTISITEYDTQITETTYTVVAGEKTDATYPDVTFDPASTTSQLSSVDVSWEANEYFKAGNTTVEVTDAMLEGTVYTIPYSSFDSEFKSISSTTASVIIKGAIGAKKLTLTNSEDNTKIYTVEWSRANGKAASSDYTGDNRQYLRSIEDLPYGIYNVSVDTTDYYSYTGADTLTIDSSIVDDDTVLTLSTSVVANDKTMSDDVVANKKATFDFSTTTGENNEYLNIQNPSNPFAVFANNDSNIFMNVSGAKFNSVDRQADIQANQDTILSIYLTNGANVTLVGKSDVEAGYTVGENKNTYKISKDGSESYTYSGESGFVDFKIASKTIYLTKVIVDYTTETPEFVTAPTDSIAGAIKADGEFYAYALVSANELKNYSGVTFSMGESSVTVTEVYKTVTFDSGELTDPNGKYMAIIYTDSDNADNITSKVTYTFDQQA